MEIIETTIKVLKSMEYEPIHDEEKENINFLSFGFENFKQSEKDTIKAIMGECLMEFYYAHNTQYIYYSPDLI